jgi:hypothetical protein
MKGIAILLLLLPLLGACTTAHYHYIDSAVYRPSLNDVDYSDRHRYTPGSTVIHRHNDARPSQNRHTHSRLQDRLRRYHYQHKKKYPNHSKRQTRNNDKRTHGHD